MALPRLVERFADATCFTLDEAVDALGKEKTAVRKDIDYLKSEGWIESVRRGLYAIDPDRPTTRSVDPYVLASKVTNPYLVGHHTALELHGVAESGTFDTLYVSAPRRFEPFTYRGTTIRQVTIDETVLTCEHATQRQTRSGEPIELATRELALLQCADRPRYAGGLPEIMASVAGFPYLRWEALLELLECFDKTVLYRKVGFLVDVNRQRWSPPEDVLDTLGSNLGEGNTYFGIAPNEGGEHVSEWQLVVPPQAAEGSSVG